MEKNRFQEPPMAVVAIPVELELLVYKKIYESPIK
jgi:hypothetical protein